MNKPKWRKVGSRSLRHQESPDIVVRFRGRHPPKAKLLGQERVSAETLAALVKEAQEVWNQL